MWEIPIELRRRYPNIPIIVDPSHMGGTRDLIQPLSQQAIDMGFEGLMIESHCNPDKAWSDAKQQVTPANLGKIVDSLVVRSVSSDNKTFKDTLGILRDQIEQAGLDISAQQGRQGFGVELVERGLGSGRVPGLEVGKACHQGTPFGFAQLGALAQQGLHHLRAQGLHGEGPRGVDLLAQRQAGAAAHVSQRQRGHVPAARTAAEHLRANALEVVFAAVEQAGRTRVERRQVAALEEIVDLLAHGLQGREGVGGTGASGQAGHARASVLAPGLQRGAIFEEALDNGRKILVFSQFVSMLTLIRAALDEDGIRYAYLDGSTKDRQKVVEEFQADAATRSWLTEMTLVQRSRIGTPASRRTRWREGTERRTSARVPVSSR